MIAESLFFSAILFTIGVVGVLTRRNALIIFMCVELMLNAVNLSFVALSRGRGPSHCPLFLSSRCSASASEAP